MARPGLSDLHDPVVQLLDHDWSEGDPPAAHRLGIRHLVGADASEVAVHQIGADFSLQHGVTPITQVFEDQQAHHHLGRKAWPAVSAAVGMTAHQGLVDRRYDRIILEYHIDVSHPGLLQILDFRGDQPITEATLQASRLDHAIFRPICDPSVIATKTPRGRVAPGKIRDSIAALFACRRFFDYPQIRTVRSCSFSLHAPPAPAMSTLYFCAGK
jgi:hypothetical protein